MIVDRNDDLKGVLWVHSYNGWTYKATRAHDIYDLCRSTGEALGYIHIGM